MTDKKSWIYLFLFFTIIVLPDWIEIFMVDIPIKMALGELLRAYLILFIPFLLFVRWYKKYLLILLFLAMVLNPLDIGFLYLYDSRIDQIAFDVAMQTNIQESIEYTDGYRLYLAIGFLLNILILYFLYKKIQFKSIKVLRVISILSLVLILLMTYRSSKIIYGSAAPKIFTQTLYKNIITTNSPYMIFKYIFKHLEKKRELEVYKHRKKDFLFKAKKLDDKKQIHILIIGEASRYDHWQINGYDRETSPLIMQENNFITLSNAVTGSGATNWSVPMMIGRPTAEHFNDTMEESSLIGAYKESGYRTYWLSNQDWFPYLNIHVDEADEQYFLKRENRFAYDEELLLKFDEVLEKNKDNNTLIVLHIMGNHWRYDKRNPEKFDIFQPSIDRNSFLRMDNYKEKEKIINSYDNTIVYNDYFISLVLQRIKKLKIPTTMTFVADHGENLYDTNENLFGHGRRVNPYVYKVPYFFWSSDEYKKEYGDKIINIETNKDKNITSSTNLFYTMLDIAQIEYNDINLSRSIFSSKYQEEKRIVLQGLTPVDYDQFIKEKGK